MKLLEFFHTEAVVRALERAARSAAVPVGLHYVRHADEGVRIQGYGQCAACRHVAGLPGGKAACRTSRVAGARSAMTRRIPTGFVCHMGFACVAVPALPAVGNEFVLTFGPYCPAEEPRGLTRGALRGLADLGTAATEDTFPVSLSDIRVVPASAIPELAQWTVEVLAGLWRSDPSPGDAGTVEPASEDTGSGARRRRHTPPIPQYHGADIAAALIGGNSAQARALVRAALAESSGSGRRPKIAVRRARTVALVAATLEAAARADVNVTAYGSGFGELLEDVTRARTDEQLTAAGMRLLGTLTRRVERTDTPVHGLVELTALVTARLPGKVTLQEVASELGQRPTAITHRLQRKLGMSFSEYVGRIRVDKAKELLRRTRLGASEIARRVGSADASNFSKLFRRFEGMSPLEYRKRFGGNR